MISLRGYHHHPSVNSRPFPGNRVTAPRSHGRHDRSVAIANRRGHAAHPSGIRSETFLANALHSAASDRMLWMVFFVYALSGFGPRSDQVPPVEMEEALAGSAI